jgi:hypothetical protein
MTLWLRATNVIRATELRVRTGSKRRFVAQSHKEVER